MKNPLKRKQTNTKELDERIRIRLKYDDIYSKKKSFRVLKTLMDNKELAAEDWHKLYIAQLKRKNRIAYPPFMKMVKGLGELVIKENGFEGHKLTTYSIHPMVLSVSTEKYTSYYVDTFLQSLLLLITSFYILGFRYGKVFFLRVDHFAYIVWVITAIWLIFSHKIVKFQEPDVG